MRLTMTFVEVFFNPQALAIEAAIHHLQQQFTLSRERKQNVVIFTDSMSVLRALENEKQNTPLLTSLTKNNKLIHTRV